MPFIDFEKFREYAAIILMVVISDINWSIVSLCEFPRATPTSIPEVSESEPSK